MSDPRPQLVRGLTFQDTTALVVGTIIGTGVFLKTAKMAQAVGSPELVLLAWLAAGILSLAGALTYAELGAMLPKAGGEYVFLRAAYGDLPAFLFGWMRIVVGSAGSIAIFGVAFATFASALVPLKTVWVEKTFTLLGQTIHWQFGAKQIVAVGIILLFSGINCMRVVFGGRIQSLLTLAKVVGIAAIVVGVFFFAPTATWGNFRAPAGAANWSGFSAFGAAMLAALWAFDGWNNMPMVAGEVKDAGRNIPRADRGNVDRAARLWLGEPRLFLRAALSGNSHIKLNCVPRCVARRQQSRDHFPGRTRTRPGFDRVFNFNHRRFERVYFDQRPDSIRHGARWAFFLALW